MGGCASPFPPLRCCAAGAPGCPPRASHTLFLLPLNSLWSELCARWRWAARGFRLCKKSFLFAPPPPPSPPSRCSPPSRGSVVPFTCRLPLERTPLTEPQWPPQRLHRRQCWFRLENLTSGEVEGCAVRKLCLTRPLEVGIPDPEFRI